MGRPFHVTPGALVYLVLNRANGRVPLFNHEGNYAAFETGCAEAWRATKAVRSGFVKNAMSHISCSAWEREFRDEV